MKVAVDTGKVRDVWPATH